MFRVGQCPPQALNKPNPPLQRQRLPCSEFRASYEDASPGAQAELLFAELARQRGYQVRGSTPKENMYDHVDFYLTRADGTELRVDVKEAKRQSRDDSGPSSTHTWLELHGRAEHSPGWLYRTASSIIAFQTPTGFLLCEVKALQTYVQQNVNRTTVVEDTQDAEKCVYARGQAMQEAKWHDRATWVPLAELPVWERWYDGFYYLGGDGQPQGEGTSSVEALFNKGVGYGSDRFVSPFCSEPQCMIACLTRSWFVTVHNEVVNFFELHNEDAEGALAYPDERTARQMLRLHTGICSDAAWEVVDTLGADKPIQLRRRDVDEILTFASAAEARQFCGNNTLPAQLRVTRLLKAPPGQVGWRLIDAISNEQLATAYTTQHIEDLRKEWNFIY